MDRVTFAATGAIEGNTLSGVAHTYGTRTLRGSRYIQFAEGAFRYSDARAFLNHNTDLLLGRQSNGTVRLESKPDGLHYAIDLPDTSYAADLKVLVGRGDLSEMSFGVMPGEKTTEKAEDGKPVDIYTSADLFDISPVSMPAFGGTSLELHSAQEEDTTADTRGHAQGDVAPGSPADHRRPSRPIGDKVRSIPEILAAMDAAVDDGETFATLETELTEAKDAGTRRDRLAELRTPVMPAVIRATPKGDAGLDFAFDQYLRTGMPNADIQTYAQTVATTTQGGFAVPQGFLDRLVERRVAFGGFMNEAENLTTANGIPLEFPSVVPAVYTEADIAAEGAVTAAGADIVFGTVTVGAYKYVSAGTGNVPLKVTVELLQDSQFDIGAYVARHLGERIARKQAYDLCMGTGSGMPQGIAYGTAGTVEADIAAYVDLNDLVHALDPAYRPGAKWIMNDATVAIIENLASSGDDRPLIVPQNNGLAGSLAPSMLLGYPVVIDQAMPTMNADDVIGIAFGNWPEAYLVRHVKDVQVLANPYTYPGFVAFDAWARMDGRVVNAYAYVTGEGV